MNYSLVAIEGDKFQMKAWDHENNCSVVTTSTYFTLTLKKQRQISLLLSLTRRL